MGGSAYAQRIWTKKLRLYFCVASDMKMHWFSNQLFFSIGRSIFQTKVPVYAEVYGDWDSSTYPYKG